MPKEKKVIGYIAKSKFEEEFKGELTNEEVKFPKGLGLKHPFIFEETEKVYRRVSMVSGAVNKYVDHIVGEFKVEFDNENSQALIDDFIQKTNFSSVIRKWIKEGYIKGNGFMELDLEDTKIRVLNANDIYVRRTKKGKIIGYNQFKGKFKSFSKDKMIQLKPGQIAHFKVNSVGDDAYGLGIIEPNERNIESLVLYLQDLNKIMKRKAGSPYHVKVGVPGESVNPSAIDGFKNKLSFMTNTNEWVTDANVDIKVIEFKDLGKNIIEGVKVIFKQLIAGFEVPEVLFGSGELNEGIARVQLEGWQRKISAIQEEIESIIEEQIFRPLLRANKLDEKGKFIWNLPGEEEINKRIMVIKDLMDMGISIDENMRRMLQLELARIMDIENAEAFLLKPENGVDQGGQKNPENEQDNPDNPERKQEEDIQQPEVPGAKPSANQNMITDIVETKSHEEMSIREFANIKEIEGFNYTDYLVKILQRLNIDDFEQLRAITSQDITDGLLETKDINKLRIIMKEGFRKNKTIKEIESDIKDNLNLSDRIKEGKIIAAAESRPISIARTETVRLSNIGLVDLYKDNKIEKVRFLAALSARTCPICESLNGQVFTINELQGGLSQPPIHAMCRCSLIGIVE